MTNEELIEIENCNEPYFYHNEVKELTEEIRKLQREKIEELELMQLMADFIDEDVIKNLTQNQKIKLLQINNKIN